MRRVIIQSKLLLFNTIAYHKSQFDPINTNDITADVRSLPLTVGVECGAVSLILCIVVVVVVAAATEFKKKTWKEIGCY